MVIAPTISKIRFAILNSLMREFIHFFIGENGIVFSFSSCEDAERNYRENGTSQKEIKNIINENVCCAKPSYLIPLNPDDMSYVHGSVIEKTFELHSIKSAAKFDVNIAAEEGVNILSETHFVIDLSESNRISIKYQLSDGFQKGTISLSVSEQTQGDSIPESEFSASKRLYCYHEGGNDYVSVDSFDSIARYSEKLAAEIAAIDDAGCSISSDISANEATDGLTLLPPVRIKFGV